MNRVLKEMTLTKDVLLQLVQGDLTEEHVDAIVNAANQYLSHGGGIAGIISTKGGPVIDKESDDWVRTHGQVSHANPAYTHAGRLPCKYVIHAVGPIWGSGNEDAKLSSAIQGSFQLADTLNLRSISFPAISTGIFGFPKERAAKIILNTILNYFKQNSVSHLQQVRLVLYDQPTLDAFIDVWDNYDFFHS
jgi:O-acetyl-ADP-ribose deacetylase (regulator of RNase III)